MHFIDELKDLKMYRRSFLLPLNEKNKRHGKSVILFGPSSISYKNIFNNNFLINKYYNSYYIERAILYFIKQNNNSNVDNNIEECSIKLINESVNLFDNKLSIKYSGYDIYYNKVKKILNTKWFEDIFHKYKLDIKKFSSDININISEKFRISDKDTIYIVPERSMKSAFKKYEIYCKFSSLVWLAFNLNPNIDENLAIAFAMKECGIVEKYTQSNWPFNHNLGILIRSLYLYESENGFDSYINDIIKGYNGKDKLSYRLYDLIGLVFKDIKNIINEDNCINRKDSICLNESMYMIINENTNDSVLKKILFNDRIRSIKELKEKYSIIKDEFKDIKYTYSDLSLYNKMNVFIDYSIYNEIYIKNSVFEKKRGFNIYTDLMSRLFNNKKIIDSGYDCDLIIIPVIDWFNSITDINSTIDFLNINKTINPLSCIYKMMVSFPEKLKEVFNNKTILFLGDQSYMKLNFSNFDSEKRKLFYRDINMIINRDAISSDVIKNIETSSPKAIKTNIIDKIEVSKNIRIDDISTNTDENKNMDNKDNTLSDNDKLKQDLVKIVDDASKNKNDEDSALDAIDADEDKKLKKILSDLSSNPDSGSNISGARASRLLKLQQDFLDSDFNNKKIRDILNSEKEPEIEPLKLDIDSVNNEWKNLKFAKTLDSYNLDEDILKIFGSFSNASNPLVIRDISKEDTSTSEDLVITYKCNYESARGERFNIVVDIPKFIDNKYMKLRGNRKNIPIQLFLMPIIKTGEDTVQIVSCYNKIFIRRFGSTAGKSNVCTDKLIKALTKNKFNNINITIGENSRVCSKYELPIDYIDLASVFSKIETKNYIFYFNQDELYNKYDINENDGLCIGINKKSKNLLYYKPNPKEPIMFSYYLYLMISSDINDPDFNSAYNNASKSVRYCYSRASILSSDIPLILICAYSEGLETVLKKAKIKYNLSEGRPKIDSSLQDIIKFNDGYLTYDITYESSLLLNGLKACDTENYSITNINSKTMYLNFLDMFGGRIKADGLDNFYDCMIDPITKETLLHYNLPTDYVDVLLHANLLLSDNKFVPHGNIRASRRFRRIEIIADLLYKELSSAYGAYSTGLKHGRKVGFSIKQSSVIDSILVANITEDQSILNPVGEYEAYYSVTPRGPSGMNSDRSYSLDKRSYDESMINILSTSTAFAGTVGINRQATIDANISGNRGYIYNDPSSTNKEINPVKTLCMTESLTPFGTTRDDPMRQAMGFIQKSKHSMRHEHADPLLITNGGDEALPYLISNTFAYKAKNDGTVIEMVPNEYMIIKYKTPIVTDTGKISTEYIKLSEEVQKNSSSGFYTPLKLDTDLREGQSFKTNQIIAYDKSAFSDEIGYNNNIAYKVGTLAKISILNTDEGFEDSAIISEELSEALTSDVILEKEITISKDTNIYNLVKEGQQVQEGDTLLIIQNAYDEDDTNRLIKKLNSDENEITELGRKTITSKVTGIIQSIVICRTVETSELSPTLKKIVSSYENEIKKKKQVMKRNGIEDINHDLPDIGPLPATGKLKNATDSVVIRIYMKYRDKFSIGDKLIYGTAVKGVDKDIFPKGKNPYSEYRKDENIHTLLSIGSINARMVTSVLINAGINKALIELSRKCKDIAGIPYDINLL